MKTTIIAKHVAIQMGLMLSLGAVYAAWNDDVTTSDTLTATRWNDLVTQVESISSNGGKFIDGVESDEIYYSAANVGIGTNNPGSMLDVNSASSNIPLTVRSDQNSVGVRLQANSKQWELFNTPGVANQGFGIYDRTNSTYRFAIDGSNGNVGIGTTSPGTDLHIEGNSGEVGVRLENDGSGASDWSGITLKNDTGANGFLWLASSNYSNGRAGKMVLEANSNTQGLLVKTNSTGGMTFSTNSDSNESVYTHAGNWGINKTSADSELDVNGTIRATELCDENGSNCNDLSSGLGGGGGGGSCHVETGNDADTSYATCPANHYVSGGGGYCTENATISAMRTNRPDFANDRWMVQCTYINAGQPRRGIAYAICCDE